MCKDTHEFVFAFAQTYMYKVSERYVCSLQNLAESELKNKVQKSVLFQQWSAMKVADATSH